MANNKVDIGKFVYHSYFGYGIIVDQDERLTHVFWFDNIASNTPHHFSIENFRVGDYTKGFVNWIKFQG